MQTFLTSFTAKAEASFGVICRMYLRMKFNISINTYIHNKTTIGHIERIK